MNIKIDSFKIYDLEMFFLLGFKKIVINSAIYDLEMSLAKQVENISAEIDDKATEEKILVSEAIENILHQEDRVTSNEKPTIDIDSEKASELDIACVQTDTQAKEEVCLLSSLTFSTLMTTPAVMWVHQVYLQNCLDDLSYLLCRVSK